MPSEIFGASDLRAFTNDFVEVFFCWTLLLPHFNTKIPVLKKTYRYL